MSVFSTEEQKLLESFFNSFNQKVKLSKRRKKLLQKDFEKAIMWYKKSGININKSLELINLKNIGSFYKTESTKWWPLDDAAKIYPLSMTDHHMSIFRLSLYLKEKIIPEILQLALNFTIKRFPYFATTVKKGIFWHYIDSKDGVFRINEENKIPCSRINISKKSSNSFRITYYKNKISVEFFHILTDGTGGMIFLKTLTAQYLRLLGNEITNSNGILNINEEPKTEEERNEFPYHLSNKASSGFVDKPAIQLKGKRSKHLPHQIIHFNFESNQLKNIAKEKNSTITAFILALIFIASKKASIPSNKKIQIQVPVNMRKYYNSTTIRNFAMYCSIRLDWNEITTVDEILPKITNQLKNNASLNQMEQMVNATVKMVKYIHYIPLFLKTPISKIIYHFLGDKVITTTLSNLGKIDIPSEMSNHLKKADFILGTTSVNKVSCALITLNNETTLSLTKNTTDSSFETNLFKLIENQSLSINLTGSQYYGN